MRFRTLAPNQPKTVQDTQENHCYTCMTEQNADRLCDLLNDMHDEMEHLEASIENLKEKYE